MEPIVIPLAWEKDRKIEESLHSAWMDYCEFRIDLAKSNPVGYGLHTEQIQLLSGIAKFYLNAITGIDVEVCAQWVRENSSYIFDDPAEDQIYYHFIALMKEEIANDWVNYLALPSTTMLWVRAKAEVHKINRSKNS